MAKEIHILAKPQKTRLGTDFIRNAIPFRAADGGEQHRVRRLRARHVGIADRGLVNVIGGAADKAFFDFEMDNSFAREPSGDFLDLGHDLGADAVARKNEKLIMSHALRSMKRGAKAEPQSSRCPRTPKPKNYAAASWRST